MFVECEKQFAPPNYFLREGCANEINRLTSIESVPENETVEPSCLSDSLVSAKNVKQHRESANAPGKGGPPQKAFKPKGSTGS